MSTRILDAGATLAEDEMKAIVKECEGKTQTHLSLLENYAKSMHQVSICTAGVCLATDSWTSIRRRQIMAFVIITSERQVGSVTCCAYVLTYMQPPTCLQLERLQHSYACRHCHIGLLTQQQSATSLRSCASTCWRRLRLWREILRQRSKLSSQMQLATAEKPAALSWNNCHTSCHWIALRTRYVLFCLCSLPMQCHTVHL